MKQNNIRYVIINVSEHHSSIIHIAENHMEETIKEEKSSLKMTDVLYNILYESNVNFLQMEGYSFCIVCPSISIPDHSQDLHKFSRWDSY